MDLGLKGRVALVTGGSRGIGCATARVLAKEGAKVGITYRERRENANAVVNEIRANGGDASAFEVALESPGSIERAVHDMLALWGRIDVLINNAVATKIAIPDSSVSEWQALVRVNIEGTHQVTQATLSAMRTNRWGRIVNISSALAVDGTPGLSWYATAKSALHGMTRTLSKELGPFGILVNAVMPGLTLTAERPVHISQRHLENVAAALPIRRLPLPEEVAQVVVFLASARNRIVTGEIIRVSGGK